MRYHDYHLCEYKVSDFGRRITLHRVFDYPGKPKDESSIEFSNVSLYNFVHMGGAIVTHFEESPVKDRLDEVGASVVSWQKQHGLEGWRDTLANYQQSLEARGQKAWRIDSAIGFSGFVVAQAIAQIAPDKSPERTREG